MFIFKEFLAVLLAALEVSSLRTSGPGYALLNSSVVPALQGCTINSVTDVASVTASCTTITVGSFNVPANYQPLIMNLKQTTRITFTGQITFDKKADWNAILIEIIGNGVTVEGSNTHEFYGRGELYWDGKGYGGAPKPVFMYLKGQGSTFSGLKLKNCPIRCVAVDSSNNVVVTNFLIDNQAGAQGKAPQGKYALNTDGFDVANSQYVTIKDSVVYNQDDCVAINSGAHMLIDRVNCDGSHGFDIATGMSTTDQSRNIVNNITFQNSNLNNGMYGLHILTCSDGGKGYVKDITYNNININGPSGWGINIQQDFSNAKQQSTGIPVGTVPISNVKYNGITGKMNGPYAYALSIRCAAGACRDINFNSVKIDNGKSANECWNYKIQGWC